MRLHGRQAASSRRQFDPQWHNFNPRFGFAYQATANTVIRGGFGIFYAPTLRGAGATVGSTGFGNTTNYAGSPDGLTPAVYLSNPFPTGLNLPVGNSQGLLTGIGSSFETPMKGDNEVPYTEEMWNLDIQRQLPGGILIDAAYVGTHGVHLNLAGENNMNLNQLTPDMIALGTKLQQSVANPFYRIITTGPEAAATVPLAYLLTAFPQFTEVDNMFPTGGYSEYNALQLKVEKRFSHGLTMLASFTGQKTHRRFLDPLERRQQHRRDSEHLQRPRRAVGFLERPVAEAGDQRHIPVARRPRQGIR